MADLNFKVCVCGESGVGKSWFLSQAMHKINNKPRPTHVGVYVTIGMDMRTLTVKHERSGRTVSLTMWDTAGQEKVRESLVSFYWRDAHAIVFVYDICDLQSYDARYWWLDKGLKSVSASSSARAPFVVYIGNKLDLAACDRQVAQQDVADECEQRHYSFMEVSALTGDCVQEAVMQLVDALLARDGLDRRAEASRKEPASPAIGSGKTVSLVRPESSAPRGCCG